MSKARANTPNKSNKEVAGMNKTMGSKSSYPKCEIVSHEWIFDRKDDKITGCIGVELVVINKGVMMNDPFAMKSSMAEQSVTLTGKDYEYFFGFIANGAAQGYYEGDNFDEWLNYIEEHKNKVGIKDTYLR